MQPCPSCGGAGIDANGYCTQCRTYRGVPQTPPPPGGAAPYPGYPTSPGPTYPVSQVSGSPFPSTTYGGPYGAPTSAPGSRRNSFTVPLLALCGVLALLVVAIVIVVVVKNSGGDAGTATPGGSDQPATSLVDDCVVGTWQMVSYREDVAVPDVGKVPFEQVGTGATVKLGKDGQGVQDYGSGTNYAAELTVSGTKAKVNLKITGTVTYDYRTNDNTMSFSNTQSNAKATVSVPATGASQTQDLEASDDPSKYTCDGDRMTISTSLYQGELKRVSASA